MNYSVFMVYMLAILNLYVQNFNCHLLPVILAVNKQSIIMLDVANWYLSFYLITVNINTESKQFYCLMHIHITALKNKVD